MRRPIVVITEDDELGDLLSDMLSERGYDVMVEPQETRAFDLARAYPNAVMIFHQSMARSLGLGFRRARTVDPALQTTSVGVCVDDDDAVPFSLEEAPMLRLPPDARRLERFLLELGA